MLDGILGRGFSAKCKSLIKMAKSRIEGIRRKRNATLKFLKKDMADLLFCGLDANAYGRAEGLLAELILSSCYDYVEKSGDFVLKHLSVMQKVRHCPEDCREAVSSLMFAAARFSDLPELRDLRDVFYERYGNSLELFANQEFVDNLSAKPSTSEKKVQLMHDIASEFGIAWDSRAFEQRAAKDSKSPKPVQDPPKLSGSSHSQYDKYKSPDAKDTVPKPKNDVLPKERHANDGFRLVGEKESNASKRNGFNSQYKYDVPGNGYKTQSVEEEPVLNRDNYDISFKRILEVASAKGGEPWKEDVPSKSVRSRLNSQLRYEVPINAYKPPNLREESILRKDIHNSLFQGNQEVAVEKHELRKDDSPLTTARLGSASQRKRLENVGGGSSLRDGRENTVPKTDDWESSSCGKQESYAGLWSKGDSRGPALGNHPGDGYNATNSSREVQEESRKLNPFLNNAIPPPYTKPNNSKLKDGNYGGNLGSSLIRAEEDVVHKDHSRDNRVNAGVRSDKILQKAYYLDHGRQAAASTRANGLGHENDNEHKDDVLTNPIPKPRSSRRRHSKSQASHDDAGDLEGTGIVKRRSRSRRRDESKRGLALFDDEHYRKDEEERMMDKLLLHYSSKPSPSEPGTVRIKSRSHHAHHRGTEFKSPRHISEDGPDEISEMIAPPRSISLPREQTTTSPATNKVFTRAASFQPDRTPAKHVHPKLPDYDDLAAQFAALKGR